MSIKIMSCVWESGDFDGAALIMLLALADQANDEGWSWPSVEALQKKTRLAERTIYTTIKTLVDSGWLTKTQREGSKRVFYQVHPPALNAGDNLKPPAPDAVNAALSAVKTAPDAKPPHPLKGGTVKNRQEPSGSLTLPSWLSEELWSDYLEMRKKIKKPMTGKAMRLAIAKLENLHESGQDWKGILEKAIFSSWQGLYGKDEPPRNGGNGNGRSTSQSKQDATIDAARQVIASIRGVDYNGTGQDSGLDGGASEPGAPVIDARRAN